MSDEFKAPNASVQDSILITLSKKYFVAVYISAVLIGLLITQRAAGPVTILMLIFALSIEYYSKNLGFKESIISLGDGPTKSFFFAGFVFVVWSIVSISWSVTKFDSFSRSGKLALFLFAAVFLCNFVSKYRQTYKLNIGIVTMTVFSVIITYSYYKLGGINGVILFKIISVPTIYFNRIFVTIVLLSLSIAGVASAVTSKKERYFYLTILASVSGFASFSSDSQTSMLAWVIGWTLVPICIFFGKKVQIFLLSLICIIPVLTPFLIYFGYSQLIKLAYWDISILKHSSIRLGIWLETIKLIIQRPILGYGNDALENVFRDKKLNGELFEGIGIPATHPHNAPLQVWLEFGAIGVVLVCFMLASAAFGIAKLPDCSRPFAIASLGSMIIVSVISHGAWQSWWIGTLILLCTVLVGLYRSNISTGHLETPPQNA